MRKPRAIAAHERILLGDAAVAAAMGDALAIDVFDDRYTHLFHTYPAGLNPDTAKSLLELFPGESVYDPFCGGGTVLVEARVAGRKTAGTDLSRTAIRTALARTSTATEETLTKARSL
ncbi:MAG: tRNA G10 N-methylase Trm11, partial [Myxococcota bacterium]